MPPSMRLSKIQAALLRNLRLTAQLTGESAKVRADVVRQIADHYFRAIHIDGALKELHRMGWLTRPTNPYVSIAQDLLPHHSLLPGEPPLPLGRRAIEDILRHAGLLVVEFVPEEEEEEDEEEPLEICKQWMTALADHRYLERWYGAPLPSVLSREVFLRNYPNATNPVSKRSQLRERGWLRATPEPNNGRAYAWQVTERASAAMDAARVRSTYTTISVKALAVRLNISPQTSATPAMAHESRPM